MRYGIFLRAMEDEDGRIDGARSIVEIQYRDAQISKGSRPKAMSMSYASAMRLLYYLEQLAKRPEGAPSTPPPKETSFLSKLFGAHKRGSKR
jgi:hypothetical protein